MIGAGFIMYVVIAWASKVDLILSVIDQIEMTELS